MSKTKTQIVATIGPASEKIEIVKAMIKAGANIARLNFSYGDHIGHLDHIKNVREAAAEVGVTVSMLQDLSGPREQDIDGHQFDKSSTEVFTEKDLSDLKFGIENSVEYVAMSYVGTAEDVAKLRSEMQKIVDASNGLLKNAIVIAKIERKIAIENFDSILAVSDGIMIARGDMGNEVPLEQIPFVEKMIIEKCNKAGKFVITATQMMLSMKDNPVPTRAEVTDVAFAVVTGSDAVMLSEESASGKYPVEAVTMMKKIIVESEKHS
jgi:pyruvate kinase